MFQISTITVDNLRSMLLKGERARYIDLREPRDFAAEYVPGFTNVPLGQLAEHKDKWAADEPLVLFCTNGTRAHHAIDQLKSWGFNDVRVVAGGLLAWKVQTFPIKRPAC